MNGIGNGTQKPETNHEKAVAAVLGIKLRQPGVADLAAGLQAITYALLDVADQLAGVRKEIVHLGQELRR